MTKPKIRLDRELFVQKYQEMHRLGREADGSVTLYIGAENWPFPVPLVEKNGVWRFDPDAGQKEVSVPANRRERTHGDCDLPRIRRRRKALSRRTEHCESGGQLSCELGSESGSANPVAAIRYYFMATIFTYWRSPKRATRPGTEGRRTGASR